MIDVEFSELKGQTLTHIKVESGRDGVTFITDKGVRYRMLHYQECCESVTIEDICGDLGDLIGSPILLAEEVSSNDLPSGAEEPEYRDESETWTFYKLSTNAGSVTIRWYGSSNGYYSESVDFERDGTA